MREGGPFEDWKRGSDGAATGARMLFILSVIDGLVRGTPEAVRRSGLRRDDGHMPPPGRGAVSPCEPLRILPTGCRGAVGLGCARDAAQGSGIGADRPWDGTGDAWCPAGGAAGRRVGGVTGRAEVGA